MLAMKNNYMQTNVIIEIMRQGTINSESKYCQ